MRDDVGLIARTIPSLHLRAELPFHAVRADDEGDQAFGSSSSDISSMSSARKGPAIPLACSLMRGRAPLRGKNVLQPCFT
jgi:hypothetical protein